MFIKLKYCCRYKGGTKYYENIFKFSIFIMFILKILKLLS